MKQQTRRQQILSLAHEIRRNFPAEPTVVTMGMCWNCDKVAARAGKLCFVCAAEEIGELCGCKDLSDAFLHTTSGVAQTLKAILRMADELDADSDEGHT